MGILEETLRLNADSLSSVLTDRNACEGPACSYSGHNGLSLKSMVRFVPLTVRTACTGSLRQYLEFQLLESSCTFASRNCDICDPQVMLTGVMFAAGPRAWCCPGCNDRLKGRSFDNYSAERRLRLTEHRRNDQLTREVISCSCAERGLYVTRCGLKFLKRPKRFFSADNWCDPPSLDVTRASVVRLSADHNTVLRRL